jgi:predicted nucleic acid-binding protein
VPAWVVDASAAVELLLRTESGRRAAASLRGARVAAPAHLDAEVLSAIGCLVRAGEVAADTVPPILDSLARAPFTRYPLPPLLTDAWHLRANLSLRDALYVLLARRLGATLLTADARLARAPGLEVTVAVI